MSWAALCELDEITERSPYPGPVAVLAVAQQYEGVLQAGHRRQRAATDSCFQEPGSGVGELSITPLLRLAKM